MTAVEIMAIVGLVGGAVGICSGVALLILRLMSGGSR